MSLIDDLTDWAADRQGKLKKNEMDAVLTVLGLLQRK